MIRIDDATTLAWHQVLLPPLGVILGWAPLALLGLGAANDLGWACLSLDLGPGTLGFVVALIRYDAKALTQSGDGNPRGRSRLIRRISILVRVASVAAVEQLGGLALEPLVLTCPTLGCPHESEETHREKGLGSIRNCALVGTEWLDERVMQRISRIGTPLPAEELEL